MNNWYDQLRDERRALVHQLFHIKGAILKDHETYHPDEGVHCTAASCRAAFLAPLSDYAEAENKKLREVLEAAQDVRAEYAGLNETPDRKAAASLDALVATLNDWPASKEKA